MSALEAMRNDYKDDEVILNELRTTPEKVIDFDRTWNGNYKFARCGDCSGPTLGHRMEKCREKDGVYAGDIVKRYEDKMRSCNKIREILNEYIDKKKELEEQRNFERTRALPAQTNLMIGRTEIPKWIGQEFDVWKKELEK